MTCHCVLKKYFKFFSCIDNFQKFHISSDALYLFHYYGICLMALKKCSLLVWIQLIKSFAFSVSCINNIFACIFLIFATKSPYIKEIYRFKVRSFLEHSCVILSSFKIVVISNVHHLKSKQSQLMHYWKLTQFWKIWD